jgi:hypothetical protein
MANYSFIVYHSMRFRSGGFSFRFLSLTLSSYYLDYKRLKKSIRLVKNSSLSDENSTHPESPDLTGSSPIEIALLMFSFLL